MSFSYQSLSDLARPFGLALMGGLAPTPDDPVPAGTRAIVLLGPDGQAFWRALKGSPEFGQPDPVDRYSTRVISGIALESGSTALFPFGQVPPMPFIGWALRSGQAHVSDAQLLIHAKAGLWASYRGALALPFEMDLPAPAPNPCASCAAKPCLDACPPRALDGSGYNVPACHAFLDTPAGVDCLNAGCAVRRACPVSQGFDRPPEQSAHHMRYFHR